MLLPLSSGGDACSVAKTEKSVRVCSDMVSFMFLPFGIGLGEEGGFRSSYLNNFKDLEKTVMKIEACVKNGYL